MFGIHPLLQYYFYSLSLLSQPHHTTPQPEVRPVDSKEDRTRRREGRRHPSIPPPPACSHPCYELTKVAAAAAALPSPLMVVITPLR